MGQATWMLCNALISSAWHQSSGSYDTLLNDTTWYVE
jgi:hypothetical protein